MRTAINRNSFAGTENRICPAHKHTATGHYVSFCFAELKLTSKRNLIFRTEISLFNPDLFSLKVELAFTLSLAMKHFLHVSLWEEEKKKRERKKEKYIVYGTDM